MTHEELVKNYGDFLCHCDRSFDTDFDKLVEIGHLTWRPWIGADWKTAEKHILIVGESHYAAKPDADDAEAKVVEWQTDPDGTREIVYEAGIGDWYSSRFFGNLHRALFGIDVHDEQRTTLWRNLAFYNFIQRPMRDTRERPGASEFFGGWRHFMELLKTIHPDTVIFLGVTAASHFDGAMSALGVDHSIKYDKYQNGAYPCQFSVSYDGITTNMVAIRHVSQYFSWETWRAYLAETIPDAISNLQKTVLGVHGGATVVLQTTQENTPPESNAKSEVFSGDNHLEGLPNWLQHKPVVACDYQELNAALGNFDYDDARYISVGHAQYNPDEVSVKMFRWIGRWSRQSEEVPIQRLPYMMSMLLTAICKVQNPTEDIDCGMNEKVVAPQDIDLLRDQIHVFARPLKDGLVRVRDLLNRINLEAL